MTPEQYAAAYSGGFEKTIRFIISKGVKYSDAEELAQSAWARGWQYIEQLQDESRILAWVNSIAFNALCNESRRSKRLVELDGRDIPLPCGLDLNDKLDLGKFLQKIPSHDASLLYEHHILECEFKEISARRGRTTIALRVRAHRARVSIRRHMEGGRAVTNELTKRHEPVGQLEYLNAQLAAAMQQVEDARKTIARLRSSNIRLLTLCMKHGIQVPKD